MLSDFLTAVMGWIVVMLLVGTILYPFLLRRGILGLTQPFLRRMRLHYWLGYSIIGIIIVHALLSLGGGLAESVNFVGLDFALAALCFALLQLVLGSRLRWPKLARRRVIRRWHFWFMVTLAVLLLGHIVFDSIIVHTLVSRVFIR